jgi:hypothetical protein
VQNGGDFCIITPPSTLPAIPQFGPILATFYKEQRYDIASEKDHVSIRFSLRRLQQGIHPTASHF